VSSYEDGRLVPAITDDLVAGKVVGWYQGRSEWGPRALGNRSILANPTLPNMKDLINVKIKRREPFRPFAPSVLRELVGSHFEQDVESPFMMHVVKIRPESRERLPAVTHVDGTGRLQSVSRDENPLYYELIEEFRRRTGVGVLLNTSFNENEPIVDTPEQAVACFQRTRTWTGCAWGSTCCGKLDKLGWHRHATRPREDGRHERSGRPRPAERNPGRRLLGGSSRTPAWSQNNVPA
jgi:predicted NodU family carbamoyl transferase